MSEPITTKSLRFAVIHLGPRLHYGVPAVLEEAGMLQVLYTDAHAESTGAALLRPLGAMPGGRGIRRLLARHIPAVIPRAKVRSWLRPAFQIEWLNRCHPTLRKQARTQWERGIGGHWLAQRAIEDNFGDANALYAHPCVSTDAIREAKRRGMFVVLEAISHPFNKLVEKAEFERFGRTPPQPEEEIQDNIAFFKEEARLSDIILAASPYVRDGLIDLGIDQARIAVVPYGLDSKFFNEEPSPEPGRVLFVGNIGYLKGLPSLAETSRILRSRDFPGEVRAVGPAAAALTQRPEFQGPTYIGQVPRAEVKKEFLAADVFVFPSLSDGFGIVLLEAMAAGLPVICTPNCANLVQDGENGYIVPPNDPGILAETILRVCTDRILRQRLSDRAKETAGQNKLEDHRTALLFALA